MAFFTFNFSLSAFAKNFFSTKSTESFHSHSQTTHHIHTTLDCIGNWESLLCNFSRWHFPMCARNESGIFRNESGIFRNESGIFRFRSEIFRFGSGIFRFEIRVFQDCKLKKKKKKKMNQNSIREIDQKNFRNLFRTNANLRFFVLGSPKTTFPSTCTFCHALKNRAHEHPFSFADWIWRKLRKCFALTTNQALTTCVASREISKPIASWPTPGQTDLFQCQRSEYSNVKIWIFQCQIWIFSNVDLEYSRLRKRQLETYFERHPIFQTWP